MVEWCCRCHRMWGFRDGPHAGFAARRVAPVGLPVRRGDCARVSCTLAVREALRRTERECSASIWVRALTALSTSRIPVCAVDFKLFSGCDFRAATTGFWTVSLRRSATAVRRVRGGDLPGRVRPVGRAEVSVFGVFPGCDACRPASALLAPLERDAAPVAFGVEFEDDGMVDEAVDSRHSGCFVREPLVPLTEGLVCGDQEGPALVACRDPRRTGGVQPGTGEAPGRQAQDEQLPTSQPGHLSRKVCRWVPELYPTPSLR